MRIESKANATGGQFIKKILIFAPSPTKNIYISITTHKSLQINVKLVQINDTKCSGEKYAPFAKKRKMFNRETFTKRNFFRHALQICVTFDTRVS